MKDCGFSLQQLLIQRFPLLLAFSFSNYQHFGIMAFRIDLHDTSLMNFLGQSLMREGFKKWLVSKNTNLVLASANIRPFLSDLSPIIVYPCH